MHRLEEMLDAVSASQTKVDSLIALTTSLHQAVIAAMGGTITPSQQMRIDAIFDSAKANADAIDKAITENTVDASKGAVSDGPSAADIKGDLSGGAGQSNPGNTPSGVPQGSSVARQDPSA